ncbi:MAG TPA: phage tail tape measure C-terminal domain-containing protein, partial [Amaricoccus sp.]|nr:phage tail tape measure C-terminal domain-containing protein [Amaricoccus sp.]
MVERRVSVRLAAVGGDRLKADLAAVGREGKAALAAIAGGSAPASHGLAATGDAARALVTRLEAVSARAGAAAATMRGLGSAGGVVARIDRITGVSGGVTGGLRRDAADIEAYGRALDDTRAKYNPMFAAVRSYRAELAAIRAAHATGAISADEMTAAIARTRTASLASIAAIKGRTTAIGQMASGSRLAAMQSRMLLFQLNDIGVSLAGGMSPLMVLVQQGSQITQMYAGQGGVNAALRQTADLAKGAVAGVGSAARGILGLARAHPVLTAAVALAAAGLAGLRHEINATAETQASYGDVALAVWQSVRDGAVALVKPAFDAIAAWAAQAFAAVASAASAAWDGIVAGVHVTGNAIVKAYGVVCETIGALFAAVPSAVGAAVAASANAVLAGVEWLINRVSGTLNGWIAKVNDTLGMLPDWAQPDWATIPEIPGDVSFGRYENPYAEDLAGRWRDYTGAVGGIVASDPLGDVFRDVSARAEANARAREAVAAGDGSGAGAGGSGAGGGGRAGGGAADDLKAVEEAELAGIDVVRDALSRAYDDVKDLGKGIGETLVGAFRSAEEAVGEFVKTGKLDVKSLVSSVIADFAQLAARKFLFAPLSAALSGALGGSFGGLFGSAASTVAATVSHAGGMAGAGPLRLVEAAAILGAPRLHAGTPSWLRADEYATILQRGERVLNR